MATTAAATHIVIDEKGRAWIEGTGTKVMQVVMDKLAWGWDAEQIHRQYPHLPLAKIHAALSYYYDHRAEIDAEIGRMDRDVKAMRAAAGESPLAERLRAEGRGRQGDKETRRQGEGGRGAWWRGGLGIGWRRGGGRGFLWVCGRRGRGRRGRGRRES